MYKQLKPREWITLYDEDEPCVVMIYKTATIYENDYHVVTETPFEVNHKLLSKQQIEQKYKIKL